MQDGFLSGFGRLSSSGFCGGQYNLQIEILIGIHISGPTTRLQIVSQRGGDSVAAQARIHKLTNDILQTM